MCTNYVVYIDYMSTSYIKSYINVIDIDRVNTHLKHQIYSYEDCLNILVFDFLQQLYCKQWFSLVLVDVAACEYMQA